MDLFAETLWILLALSPICIPVFVWRIKKLNNRIRILLSILLIALFTLLLYTLTLDILFRDGMGP
ncbi:MAG: hypothetical protein H6606_00065 [Flavobacteriales bacterium]|nr:hypothetical protein [Flavobacteriales bacterium]